MPNFLMELEIKEVVDLTKRETNKKTKNAEFQQVLQIYLKNSSKEKVLQAIAKLEQLDGIYSAEPNYLLEPTAIPDDPYYNSQWNLYGTGGINVPMAWDSSTGTREIRVGVIDSGIANHPDLNANLTSGKDFYNNDLVTNDDDSGHGTQVAGIIGAVGNNARGIAGINWNVSLIPMQVGFWDEYNTFWFSTVSINSAIGWASDLWGTNQQIDILNYSGSVFGDSPSILAQIKNYEGLFVWSAGNDGVNVDTYSDIGSYNINNLISVGAIDNYNQRSVWNSKQSSCYGNAVNIFAPGGKGFTDSQNIPTTNNNSGYSYFNGTSAAAPHVAGVAALLISINPSFLAEELKNIILDSADSITIDKGTVKKLNAYKAIQLAQSDDYLIGRPRFKHDTESYLFAVEYDWEAGYGGNRVAMSKSSSMNYSVYGNSSTYKYVAFPNYTATNSKTLCEPPQYYFKTYNTSTGQYSAKYSTSEHREKVGEGQYVVRYGYDCQREPKTWFDGGGYSYVPTSYDKEFFVWTHGGGNGDVIIATIKYNTTVYNIKVKIPWIGYSSTSVMLDEVKFTLRTGPKKCSVMCGMNNTPCEAFNFAFDVVGSDDPILKKVAFTSF